MEKLQLLSSPEERQRRLNELPEIHFDLSMDPMYEAKSYSSLPGQKRKIYNVFCFYELLIFAII